VLAERVSAYLVGAAEATTADVQVVRLPLAEAGLSWSSADIRIRKVIAGLVGGLAGLLAAQGDLFFAGGGRSPIALGLIGAAAGVLGLRVFITQRIERRSRQLRLELPVVCDLMALRALAGEGVVTAIEHVVEETTGVAADEFGVVLTAHRDGTDLSRALQSMAAESQITEASRLYGLLANAHVSGGRLAEALFALSTDLRAADERAIQVEGGRRALTVYAPILALMIPVALIFLMFPTLSGLSDLAALP
jgi:Flp pilus assembly protein TadB